jgi:general secretion pathway protein D
MLKNFATASGRICAAFAIMLSLGGCAAYVHHRTGMSNMDQGKYPEAIEELRQAAELKPLDVEYQRDWLQNRELATNRLLARADQARALGQATEAADQYKFILKYESSNSRALAGLEAIAQAGRAAADLEKAKAALKRGDNEEAARYADRALDRNPDLPQARAIKREIDGALSKEVPSLPNLGDLYRKPINLEFRDASIHMVFDALSRTTGINFLFDRDVKPEQRTTVFLKQTAFADAIDVILVTNQLEKKVLNATSVLIYPKTAAKLKEYQDLLVKAFYLTNVDAKTAANLLRSVLKVKDVYVDEKYHLLVLRESAETIALAEKLIALQDLEEPEVMLEVEVLEVNRARLLNLGIQLTNQFTVSPLNANSTSSGTSADANSPTYRLSDLLHLNSDKLGVTVPSATLSLQKTDGDANLLANPRLRVRDREKAKILIGDKIPVVTTTATPNGFLSESIQYLDVGLKLDVEPEIYLHDEIALKISLEVSSLVGAIKTATGSQAYQIGTRNFSSSLRLRDGETQVFAGLISDADRSNASRIPLLGDIPLLGRLFSSQKDDRQKTEIVMSITPHLIRNIQRRSAATESFWSGTESTLRTRPVLLGTVTAGVTSDKAVPVPAQVQRPAAANTSGLQLHWTGPSQVKVGDAFTLELELDTKHLLRAAPLQVAVDPTAFEIVSAKPGDYFARGSSGQFSQSYDRASGRISIGVSSQDQKAQTGAGSLVKLEMRALRAVTDSSVGLIGLTPVGATQAIQAPALPIATRISAE